MDRQTDITKLIGAFSNYANVPKKSHIRLFNLLVSDGDHIVQEVTEIKVIGIKNA